MERENIKKHKKLSFFIILNKKYRHLALHRFKAVEIDGFKTNQIKEEARNSYLNWSNSTSLKGFPPQAF